VQPNWREQAACKGDTESFFSYDKVTLARARAICARCGVRSECLESALVDRNVHGMWGGLSEAQRHKLHVRPAA
jgi:WhiB family redox-sensing transcriptional regulator